MPEKLERCVADFMSRDSNKKKWPDEKKRRQAAYAICNASVKSTEDGPRYFFAEVKDFQFDEDTSQSWVHALAYGEKYHPVHGVIDVDKKLVREMVASINERVRGIDLAIDQGHEYEDGARGWVVRAEQRDTGLWLLVDWNPTTLEELKDKRWKYFSLDYAPEWCNSDPEPQCWPNVVLGGALTNRPFMKDLVPINLSELHFDDSIFNQPDGKIGQEEAHYQMASVSTYRCANCMFFRGAKCLVVDGKIDPDWVSDYFMPIRNSEVESMFYAERAAQLQEKEVKSLDPKKFAEILGLPEDTPEEKLEERIKALRKFHDEKASEEQKARTFAEQFPDEARELAEGRTERRNMRTEMKLKEWTEGKHIIPPVVHDKIKELRVSLSEASATQFDEILDEIHKTGTAPTSERGDPGNKEGSDETVADAADRLLSEVSKLQAEGKSFDEALDTVRAANPQLVEEYYKDRPKFMGTGEESEEVKS
jgi:hypothetical protein